MTCNWILATGLIGLSATLAPAQQPHQPRVSPGPDEPDWLAILDSMYGLSMFGDLLNPVKTSPLEVPGLFRKAGAGQVRYSPQIALGLVTTNRGGWYRPGTDREEPECRELWSYTFKNTAKDIEQGTNLPPALAEGSTVAFDPGDQPFGLYVANDGLDDGGVFTEPSVVRVVNKRLASQPYKAMIYPYRDKVTGELIPNSYLIGWEYSTNDDFQDVVCLVENVELISGPINGP